MCAHRLPEVSCFIFLILFLFCVFVFMELGISFMFILGKYSIQLCPIPYFHFIYSLKTWPFFKIMWTYFDGGQGIQDFDVLL